MARSVGVAYGIAGAAVAAAIIAVAGATTGFGDGTADASISVATQQAPLDGATTAGTQTSRVVTGPNGEQIEYVYVDQPATYHDDDHEEHEHEGYEGHEDHEDDD